MEEAPENGKESSHSAHANGMNEYYIHQNTGKKNWKVVWLIFLFYVYGSVHRWSILMQHKAVYILQVTLHVSGVNHIHHQEYTKL